MSKWQYSALGTNPESVSPGPGLCLATNCSINLLKVRSRQFAEYPEHYRVAGSLEADRSSKMLVMKSRKTRRKQDRTKPTASNRKRQMASSSSDVSFETLSGAELIDALCGCCKGKTSLVAAREREHTRDDKLSERKFARFMQRAAAPKAPSRNSENRGRS